MKGKERRSCQKQNSHYQRHNRHHSGSGHISGFKIIIMVY